MKKVDYWIAWSILVAGLLVTFTVTIYVNSEIHQINKSKFKFECKEIVSKIDLRLQVNAQLLRSGAAFFGSSDTITREEWRDFTEQSQIRLNFPGVLETGFSLRIPKNNLNEHIRNIRSEGYPDYVVWPENKRETYTSIIFIEPFSKQNMGVFGYDMITDSVHREAMERARDLNLAALSGKVLLTQDTEADVQAGNLMYVPVYQKGAEIKTLQQRRAALKGWVYSRYSMNDMFSEILSTWELEDNPNTYYLDIYDGFSYSPESILFTSHKSAKQKESKIHFSLNIPIDFNGHQWILAFTQKKGNILIDHAGSWFVLTGGCIISILLFFLTRSFSGTKYQAYQIAERLTAKLQESERLLRESQKITKLGNYSLDIKTGTWESSEVLDVILGVDKNYPHSIEGWSALVHPDFKEKLMNALNDAILEKQFLDNEYKIIRNNDKEERWIHGLGKLEYDNNNNPTRLIGTVSDITEQKLNEERLHLSHEQYRSLFENSPLGIYQTTPDGKIINANSTLLEMLEFNSLSELQERNLEKEGYSEDSDIMRSEFVEMIHKDGYVKGLEESWITRTGKRIPVRENARIVKGIDGEVLFYEGTVEDITDRKMAEREIQNITSRLQLATSTANIGIWEMNPITNKVILDEVTCKLYGISPRKFAGTYEAWEGLLHPDDLPRVNEEFQMTIQQLQQEFQTEYRIIWPDKSIHYIKATGFVELDNSGKAIRVIGTNMDITERKLGEQSLKESENRMRTIFETSPVPMVMTKVNNGVVVMANDSLGKLFNLTVSEAIGKKSPDFYQNQEDRNVLLKAVMENGAVDDFEVVLKKTDGKLFHCSVSLKLMALGDEQMLIAGFHDITDRKNAEKEILFHQKNLEEMVSKRTQELTLSQQKLQQSIKDISDYKLALDESSIVAVTDLKGTITHVNDNFCKISQYNRKELIGKPHKMVNSGFHPKEFFVDLWTTISEGLVWRGEINNKAKDGNSYWVDSTIVPFLDLNGKPYQYVSVTFDVTARKSIEADLIKSKEAADAANQAKSEFLANMSHEIRTPMNAVIGFSELLSTSIQDEKKRSQVESIRSSGKNLLKIINDILDLAKIEANKIDITPAPINLIRLMSEMENMFAQKVEEKGINFSIVHKDAIPKILLLDEVRIRQILFNLIGNAVKFTDHGQITLSLNAKRKNKKSQNVDLTILVTDTGIGIPIDEQKLVFEPFNQQKGQSVMKYGGTGLGLSITKKLLHRMGGTISLQSKVGKGSTFKIFLPNISVSEDYIDTEEKAFDIDKIKFKEAKVLIADDIDENRKLIVDLLEKSPLTMLEAKNGEEAFNMAQEYLPDLILMDLRMPVMDGMESAKQLKTNLLTKSIPIIMLTASIAKTITNVNDVFDDYLFKPLDITLLFDVLKKHLKHEVLESDHSTSNMDKPPYMLSEKQKQKLPEFVKSLELEFLPKYENVIKKQVINEIEEFGKDLLAISSEMGLPILISYSNKIVSYVDSFNIEKLIPTLRKFPELVEQLKEEIKSIE
ncbi:PAS domain S-box protein [Reichenbachiella sp. MALMAid0571]|uniref:PAS domain S-box protein n=1 Tax=Reichenbachiella sp. MALMAid0571 TaxID=3143939 RepID=UPI0032DFCAE8